jgi:hypothetical protein
MTYIRVAAFVKRHAAMVKSWSRKELLQWIHWYDINNGMALVEDEKGKLIGCAFARPIADIADRNKHYAYDSKGDILWVSLVVAKQKAVFPLVWTKAIKNFGKKKYMAFSRSKYDGKCSLYNYDKMTKKLLAYG